VAQSLVEPDLLVGDRIIHVEAAPGIDEMLILVRQRPDRHTVHEADAAGVAVDRARRIRDEHVEHLPFVTAGAVRRPVLLPGEEIAGMEEAAVVERCSDGGQLIDGACKEDDDFAIPIDVRRRAERCLIHWRDESIERGRESLIVGVAEPSGGVRGVANDDRARANGGHSPGAHTRRRAGRAGVRVEIDEVARRERGGNGCGPEVGRAAGSEHAARPAGERHHLPAADLSQAALERESTGGISRGAGRRRAGQGRTVCKRPD
jgi:hypothetical protein